jgi:hypothetical protein
MKIVSAINAMLSNSSQITNVIAGEDGELFFLYGGKYKWSIKNYGSDDIGLWFYPGNQDLEDLASYDNYNWDGFNEMVLYSTKELGTREAIESFKELYRTVKERRFGVDKALDEIIGGSGLI